MQTVAATSNRIRNADFKIVGDQLRSWSWTSRGPDIRWEPDSTSTGVKQGVTMVCTNASSSGRFCQRLRCRGDQWYRIEAAVSCRTIGPAETSGMGLWVRPETAGDDERRTWLAGTLSTTGPLTLRAYFKTPPNTPWLNIEIGIAEAVGEASIHGAYVAANIQPDRVSHPMALPPPAYSYAVPRTARQIFLCDETGERRPLTHILEDRFGRRNVRHVRAGDVHTDRVASDAIIVAGDQLPGGMRSLRAVEKLAENRIIILSLGAFAKLFRDPPKIRTIAQDDDPLCARVQYADGITCGFALHDVFPLSVDGATPGAMRQRQFRNGKAIRRLTKEMSFQVILDSMTDSDATSGHPLCLHRPTDRGGIIVFDVAPAECRSSSRDESNVAAYLLWNMLGADQVSMGRYIVPEDDEREYLSMMGEFCTRYGVLRCSGRERHDTIITLGAGENVVPLLEAPRPTLLVRSGLTGHDFAGIYGVQEFLKQLVRPTPHENPYAKELVRRFRLAWVPLSAPWQPFGKFETDNGTTPQITGDFEDGSIHAIVEVTDGNRRELRVAYAFDDGQFERQAAMLRMLTTAFLDRRYFYRSSPDGHAMGDRSRSEWAWQALRPIITIDAEAFSTPFHRSALTAGAQLIRIEVPGEIGNFECNSIWRTDLAATMLEFVIGLQYGLIAMNRTRRRVVCDGFPPLEPGQSLVIRSEDLPIAANMRVG